MRYLILLMSIGALWLQSAAEEGCIGKWGLWVGFGIATFWTVVMHVAETLDKKMSASAPTENRQIYEKTHKKIVA